MHSAIDIANYVIRLTWIRHNTHVTNLHLQKILYYIYADYLVSTQQRLFNDPIEKWRYGPVIPNVYHAFKDYGVYPITQPEKRYEFEVQNGIPKLNVIEFDPTPIDEDFIVAPTITRQVDILVPQSAYSLVEKTHAEPMWSKWEDQINNGVRNLRYDDKEIIEHFSNHSII